LLIYWYEKSFNNKLERNIYIWLKEENRAPISIKPAKNRNGKHDMSPDKVKYQTFLKVTICKWKSIYWEAIHMNQIEMYMKINIEKQYNENKYTPRSVQVLMLYCWIETI